MSSLVIGLDINESCITSALVRIQSTENEKIYSIVRDTYFTRSYEIQSETDPREIISIWIQCINDLLLDFIYNHEHTEMIDGISIGMPGPMNYSEGVCLIQSSVFQKFFGLNLRLAIEYELKRLILRWQNEYSMTSKDSPHSTKKIFKTKSSRRMTFTPMTPPLNPICLTVPTDTIENTSGKGYSSENLDKFCGRMNDSKDNLDDNDVRRLSIPHSRRDTYFHDIEQLETLKSTKLTPRLWSIIEQLSSIPITFHNDALCFALGELTNDYNQGYKRILVLTLGISFGSAFIDQGELIFNRNDVPPNGTLSNCPYDQHTIADDWFSTRGLTNLYRKLRRHESPDDSSGTSSMTLSTEELQQQQHDEQFSISISYLTRRATNGDANAIKTFQTFARLLGQFLIPYINAFQTELIIIGGNLAQVWYLLEDELNLTIRKFSSVHVYFSLSQSKSISLGAVQQQINEQYSRTIRKTDQYLIPVVKNACLTKDYDLYPTHRIPIGSIEVGHQKLNEKFVYLIDENDLILVDGFVGTDFYEYASHLNQFYLKQTTNNENLPSILFYDSQTYLQIDSNLQRDLYLQSSKSFFGRVATNLDFQKDFIDTNKFSLLKSNLSYPCVVIGVGSSYVNESSPLIYIDLPKNEIYHRLESGRAKSYLKPQKTSHDNVLTPLLYEQKCLYFLDYPILNRLKQELLPRITLFIDGQRPNCPTWIDGNTFRQTLAYLSGQTIRLRPWFETEPWGGQYFKAICSNLSKSSKNYSWIYEMLPSDNGIILSDVQNHLLEFSWNLFYGSQFAHILGNRTHCRLFAGENHFPIRLNYLDTIDGSHLSLQCTPSLSYIRNNFGEKFTQDQSFYIIQTKQNWQEEYRADQLTNSKLYLGFQENINLKEFQQALISSEQEQTDVDVDKYVQCISTKIHDYFLVPNETVHALGPNQVVLEISAAPFVYSLKLYDWLRLGIDGRPRLLNIEHGMKNLKVNRHAEQLRCQPTIVHREENRYEEQHLPTHDLQFYDVYRIILESNVSIDRLTENRFHLCALVEGSTIEIEYNSFNNQQEKQIRQYNYLESFLIPASIQQYRLRSIQTKSILLITVLKWDCEKILE